MQALAPRVTTPAQRKRRPAPRHCSTASISRAQPPRARLSVATSGFRRQRLCPIQHDRYGIPGFARYAHTLSTASGGNVEVPVAVSPASWRQGPAWSEGVVTYGSCPIATPPPESAVVNGDENTPACLYFPTWELDPEQPRLASRWIARLRTYTGLRNMASKLDRLSGNSSLRRSRRCTGSDGRPSKRVRAPNSGVGGTELGWRVCAGWWYIGIPGRSLALIPNSRSVFVVRFRAAVARSSAKTSVPAPKPDLKDLSRGKSRPQ